jgi:hypothetical protein
VLLPASWSTHTALTQAFTDYNDIIDVYEGGSALLGDRIASFRGRESVESLISSETDPRSEVVVLTLLIAVDANSRHHVTALTGLVTLHFHSPGQAKQHFLVQYSLSTECPDGYEVSAVLDKCALILPVRAHLSFDCLRVQADRFRFWQRADL